MEITRGKIESALKIVVYGPEGVGKSTFLSRFPDVLFCDTEGSTKELDVSRLPKPLSWPAIKDQIKYVRDNPSICKTFALDTADWAEALCVEYLCAKAQVSGIEDFGYGKGYTYLEEEFGRILNLLSELVDRGIHVVVAAHAKMRKFEQPDEMGAYDRWEMKLEKKCYPLLKEWADMVLFANFKTVVVNVDNQGAVKGKNKAQGSRRVMYTTHHACWDAKNRFGLPEEMPFDYAGIAHLVERGTGSPAPEMPETETPRAAAAMATPAPVKTPDVRGRAEPEAAPSEAPPVEKRCGKPPTEEDLVEIPKSLAQLMIGSGVAPCEIEGAVAERGYFPPGMKLRDYPVDFIEDCLVAGWESVYQLVLKLREEMPF